LLGAVQFGLIATALGALVWWRQPHVALRESNIASAGLRLGQGPAGRHRIGGIARAET